MAIIAADRKTLLPVKGVGGSKRVPKAEDLKSLETTGLDKLSEPDVLLELVES